MIRIEYPELYRTLAKCATYLIIAGLAYLGVHRYTEAQVEIALMNPVIVTSLMALKLAELEKTPCKPKKTVVQ